MIAVDNPLAYAIGIATENRKALVEELRWECGEVEIVDDGAQFWVEQPYRVIGTGRRARTYPAQRQIRHFDRVGTLTVTRRDVHAKPAGPQGDPMSNTTAATITTAQIRALRTEANAAGDSAMVDLCDLSMASREDSNDDGTPLIGPCGGQTTRTEAREACADAINAAINAGA